MVWKIARTLRTSSSERLLIQGDAGKDVAAVDLHYLPDQRVAGTIIILDTHAITEAQVPELLREIDERLLPEASLEDGKVTFTVVVGHVLGTFFPHPE